MVKLIKIIKCNYCRSEDIDTDSKTYFKCKLCGYEWQVIDKNEEGKQIADDEKTISEKQNKYKKQ